MMHVFDKNQSRWIMKRAHELAKRYFKVGSYHERFAQGLKLAHAEAADLVCKYNGLLNRFKGHDNCFGYISSMGRDMHDRLITIDPFAYDGFKALRVLGCFQNLFFNYKHAYKSWSHYKYLLTGIDHEIASIVRWGNAYHNPDNSLEYREAFYPFH